MYRFPGFSGNWNITLVKDICDINTGKSNTQDQVDNGKYPFYIRSATPVKSNRYRFDCEAVITIGDGQIGRVFHYVNGKFDLHQRCYMMSNFRDISPRYFYYFFSEFFYERAMRLTAKATVDSVRLEMISDMPIFLPPTREEQEIIAECLGEIDAMISAQDQKVKSLKAHKKGLTQLFFPGPGASTPTLRFPGYTGEWKERRLGDVLDYEQPTQYLVSSDSYHKKGTPVLTAGKTFILGYTDESYGIYDKVPVIIFDDFVTESKYVTFPFKAKSSAMKMLFLKNKSENLYFAYNVLLLNQKPTGDHKRHWISETSQISVLYPPTEAEQQKIASCLFELDTIIKAESEKLDVMKTHKKGLMQQLFPKPIK